MCQKHRTTIDAKFDRDFFSRFWVTNCQKFKIDLRGRYVAQNLQKCVQILIQFSESKSNQNWGCCGPKTIGQKKSEKMVRKKVGKGQKKWSEF